MGIATLAHYVSRHRAATLMILLALGAFLVVMAPSRPAPTVDTIKDQHEDCGSGGEDYAALQACLVERYRWPEAAAERFTRAVQYRHAWYGPGSDELASTDEPRDWLTFRRYADDLLATYRTLGVEDVTEIEAAIWADSGTRAISDSISDALRREGPRRR